MRKIDYVSYLRVVHFTKMAHTIRMCTANNTADTTTICSAIDNSATALKS